MQVPPENVQVEITAHTSSTVIDVRFPWFLNASVCLFLIQARFFMPNVKHFAFDSEHETI